MNQATQRLFFALWPDAILQRALHRVGQRLQTAFGGRVVAEDRIHLTLAFLGAVVVDRADELRAIGASVTVERFQIELIRTGCWRRSEVGWIAPDDLPAPFEMLVLGLRERLLNAGFRVDDKPFAPHVTLLRRAKCRTQEMPLEASLRWRVDRFVLIRSATLQSGPEYTQIGAWSLG